MSDRNTKVFHGRRELSGWLHKPLQKIQRKRGFAESRLLTDWPKIVGAALAQHCVPQKLSFPKGQGGATLTVICESGWAMELQFQQEVICEKIAGFFGYRAVDQIRIKQGVLPQRPVRTRAPETINPEEAPEPLRAQVSDIADDSLKEALLRLGLSRQKTSKLEKEPLDDDI